jgi:hypothetical protein
MIEEKLGPDGSYVQKDEPEERKGDAPFKRRRLFDDEPNAARAGIPKREPDPEPEEELAPIDEPEEEGKREAGPWPEAPLPPKGATALERLTYPRGLLGHAVQYIYDTMNLPDRTMALAGALSACGKGIDRKVIGPTGNGTVLFNLVIGDSTSGKQRVISCIRLMLRAMGEEHCLPAGGIASVQSIEEMLEGTAKQPAKPSVLVVIDEYGSFLTRISSKHQTGNVSQIPATLQTLWGWPPEDVWVGSMKVGKEMDKAKVYGPAFSILALTTDRSFYGALKSKDISNGLVNRHNIFNVGRGAEEWVDAKYHYTKFPKWLGEALKKVAGQPAPLNNTPTPLRWPNGTIRAMLWDFRRIDWNAETKDRWFKFINRIRKMPSDQREVWGRAADIALRMATIVAVFRGSKIIEIEDMDYQHRSILRARCAGHSFDGGRTFASNALYSISCM